MDATDEFGTPPSDDAGTSARADGERPRHDEPADAADDAGAPPGGPPGATGDAHDTGGEPAPRRRPAKGRATEDPAIWARHLEALGFTPAEAGRLIFERVRPRDEGLVRTLGSDAASTARSVN